MSVTSDAQWYRMKTHFNQQLSRHATIDREFRIFGKYTWKLFNSNLPFQLFAFICLDDPIG